MAMANMNLIGVFVTKLWPVQALACSGGSTTKNIIPPKFSNFGDIINVLPDQRYHSIAFRIHVYHIYCTINLCSRFHFMWAVAEVLN